MVASCDVTSQLLALRLADCEYILDQSLFPPEADVICTALHSLNMRIVATLTMPITKCTTSGSDVTTS